MLDPGEAQGSSFHYCYTLKADFPFPQVLSLPCNYKDIIGSSKKLM